MLKKFLSISVALAVVLAMFVIPSTSGAATFTDSCVIDIDYTKKSVDDSKGALAFARDVAACQFVEDLSAYGTSRTGLDVASVGNSLKYTGSVTLGQQFAYEFYGVFNPGELFTRCNYPCEIGADGSVTAWTNVGPVVGGAAALTTTNTYDWTKAHHVIITGNVDTYSIYVDGQLAASRPLEIPTEFAFCDSIYLGGQNPIVVQYLMLFRVYNSAPTAEEALALYNAAAGVEPSPSESTEPTPSEGTEPSPTESAEPNPTAELPVLPSGEDFTVTAEDVPAFKAGDTVTLKFTVSEIAVASGILGMDLYFAYDPSVLQPAMVYDEDEEADVLALNSSSEAINSASGSSKCSWWASGKINETDPGHPVIEITMLEDNGNEKYAVKEAGKIWVSVTFNALADATSESLIAYTTSVGGTTSVDDNVETIEGTGSYVYVETITAPSPSESTEPSPIESTEPSPSESAVPSPSESTAPIPTTEPEEPTPAPSDGDQDNDIPETFDAGFVSLAAVALSSVVAVRKKKH